MGDYCDACVLAWDQEPMGVCSRRVLCQSCYWKNKKIHTEVVAGRVSFRFENPNALLATSVTSSTSTMCTELAIPPHELTQRREQHEDEMAIRIRWCLEHNLLPAHEHVHLAPGDDSRFMVSASVTGAPSSNYLLPVSHHRLIYFRPVLLHFRSFLIHFHPLLSQAK